MPKIPEYQSHHPIPVAHIPRGNIIAAGYVGDSVAKAGQAVFDVGDAFREAQRATDLSNYTIDATRQLNDLELEYNNIPRPDPATFSERSQEIRETFTNEIEDTVVKRMFTSQFNKTLLFKEFNVQRVARQKQVEHSRATLDENLLATRELAALARTPGERTHLITRGQAAITGRFASGVISETDAVNLMQKFEGDLLQDQAKAQILVDPVQAAEDLTDPKKYQGIPENIRLTLLERAQQRADALDREQVRQDEQLQQRLRKVRDDIIKDNDFSYWQRAFAEDLTGPQLEQAADNREVSLTAYKGIQTFMQTKEEDIENDPVIVGEITEDIILGRDADAKMNKALANGQITPMTYISMKKARASSGQKQGFSYISDALKPTAADQWSADKNFRYAEANERYLQLVADGMEPMEAATKVVDGYRTDLQRTFNGLPAPMYMPPGGDKRTYSDLDQAELETVRQYTTGRISEGIYTDQMKVITELKALLNQTAEIDQAGGDIAKRLKKSIKE